MRAREELILRCARRREASLGGLSPAGFAELEAAVRENVSAFIDTTEEAAFAELARTLEAYQQALREGDALDDEAYAIMRTKSLDTLHKATGRILKIDPNCVDARHIHIMSTPPGIGSPDRTYSELVSLYRDSQKPLEQIEQQNGGHSWNNVFLRPHLRLIAALARHCVFSTRYRAAVDWGTELLELCPSDEPGVRHTMALSCARLEDEAALNALDDRFDHQSSSWMLLARTILLYRLERYGAARRALRGYVELVRGGAFALLRPVLLPPYLPDRPEAEPLGFDAALQTLYETETIIADTPGFVWWAQNQGETLAVAQQFAHDNGFEWDQ